MRGTDLLGSAPVRDLEALAPASRLRTLRRGQAAGTRQSVNAALRGFERRGWIEAQDRAVTVKQQAALAQFAGN